MNSLSKKDISGQLFHLSKEAVKNIFSSNNYNLSASKEETKPKENKEEKTYQKKTYEAKRKI